MDEASEFLEGKGAIHQTLRRIARRLNELGIPYAVAGGLSLFAHGYQRFTKDVDLLVTREGLRKIHKEMEGLGYIPVFRGSKNLQDTESRVNVEFLVAGQFPGDGKKKPVAFPDPDSAAVEIDGIKYLNLRTLVELKLASGMTNSGRLRDVTDVMELVRILNLPGDFSEQLAPFVRQKYLEVWQSVRGASKRYMQLWRNKFLTLEAKTVEDMIATLRGAAETLEAMRADGVTLDSEGGTGDDYAYLITSDPEVAKKYDMHEESEFWAEEEDEDKQPGEEQQPPEK